LAISYFFYFPPSNLQTSPFIIFHKKSKIDLFIRSKSLNGLNYKALRILYGKTLVSTNPFFFSTYTLPYQKAWTHSLSCNKIDFHLVHLLIIMG
jgi:hypothetical protein